MDLTNIMPRSESSHTSTQKKYIWYDSMCIKFKSRTNKAMLLKVKPDIPLGESGWPEGGMAGTLRHWHLFTWLQAMWAMFGLWKSTKQCTYYLYTAMYVIQKHPDWDRPPGYIQKRRVVTIPPPKKAQQQGTKRKPPKAEKRDKIPTPKVWGPQG